MDWIPFAEGRYAIERAFLARRAEPVGVVLEEAVLEVAERPGGRRILSGRGRVRPLLLVELLEEGDELDLWLDLGGEYKYRMPAPRIQSGKVFSPGTSSFLQFLPSRPWEPVGEPEFARFVAGLRLLAEVPPRP